MTQMEHFLCLLWGCLIGHFIVYGWCRFWDFITRKRVEIPEIKYDVTDNPILSLKNRLGQAYVATYDRTAKKLLHRLLEYIEWIDNWHKEQVLIVENDRNGYKRKAERLQAEFEAECSKNAELTKQLKSIGEKYVFCYNMLQKEMLSDWKPIERAENVREALCTPQDEPKINDSEFVEKVRDIWAGLDNDMEYHQYSVTVRKYGECTEKKLVVLARSPIEAAKLVPKGYTVENISKLFE